MARQTSTKERARMQSEFNESLRLLRKGTYASLKKETAREQEARIARLLKPQNYGEFFEYYFGGDYIDALATSPSASFHKKGALWLRKNKVINLLNVAFRGGAKSIHANVGWAMFLMFGDTMKFMLLIGINQLRADVLLRDIEKQLRANEKIIKDFGQQYQYGSWADGNFSTKDGTKFLALGLNQPIRGLRQGSNRPQYVNIDDCEDRDVALNPLLIKKRYNRIARDLGGAYDKDIRREVFSNNYIVKKGLLDAYVKAKKIPVKGIYNGKKNKFAKVIWANALDKKGNPTWHERYTKKYWKDFRESETIYVWQSEFMNNPTEEGRAIKSEWIRYKKTQSLKKYDILVGHWDMAYTDTGDFFAYVLVGLYKGEIHVLQTFVRQVEPSIAMEWHFSEDKKRIKKDVFASTYYDAAVSQEAVFEPMWANAAKINRAMVIPLPEKGTKQNKFQRIMATLEPLFHANKLFFSEKIKDTLDCETGIEQLLALEKGGKAPDDFPDALASALQKVISAAFDGEGYDDTPLIIPMERGGY